jgi:uncharacterized membrane protein YkvI
MKTISTLVYLLVIASVCASSAVLYLNEQYNVSALLYIVWIVSLTLWIKSHSFLEDKNAEGSVQ